MKLSSDRVKLGSMILSSFVATYLIMSSHAETVVKVLWCALAGLAIGALHAIFMPDDEPPYGDE